MKYHNNLEDSQIHNAKGFSPARGRSISTKDSLNAVDWVKCNYTSSVAVTTLADVGGRLHHSYFCLYNSNDATKYAVYFDVSSVAAFTTPTGYGGAIQVNATATGDDSTAVQMAGYLHTAINGHADFSSSDDSAGAVGTVTITGLSTASPSVDFDTGFAILITDTEVVSEVLTTDGSGNIEWITKAALAAATGDMTGVDLTGGTGIGIASETGTTSGNYSATINCDLEGTELKSTGETGGNKFLREDGDATCSWQRISESFIIACSDETTALTTGAAKITFRMPYAFTLTDVRASVSTAPTGSVLTVDINEGGSTILSTKLTIDVSEETSESAATAAVMSDTALADDSEITVDIDTIGSGTAGAGLKVTLIGYQV